MIVVKILLDKIGVDGRIVLKWILVKNTWFLWTHTARCWKQCGIFFNTV